MRVNDKMQRGYSYSLTAPVGRNFDPEFRPELTPKEMLALGVFCGKYITDCREEFPASWFARARLSPSSRDFSLNYFSVDASQPLSIWRRKGWIHPDDPRGWFQWYAAITWGGASRTRTRVRLNAGRPSGGISHKSSGTASLAIRHVGRGNAKLCCTGPTTAVRFETSVPRLLMALSGHPSRAVECPLLTHVGHERLKIAVLRKGRSTPFLSRRSLL